MPCQPLAAPACPAPPACAPVPGQVVPCVFNPEPSAVRIEPLAIRIQPFVKERLDDSRPLSSPRTQRRLEKALTTPSNRLIVIF